MTKPPPTATADEPAIHSLHSTWIAAVNAGNLERLLTLMTEDAVFISPGREPFGREGFVDGFTDAHQRLVIDCRSELDEVVVTGAVAYTRAHDVLTVTPRAGGAAMHLAGHRMTIYRQQPDGRWLLARDGHTLLPAPIAPPPVDERRV